MLFPIMLLIEFNLNAWKCFNFGAGPNNHKKLTGTDKLSKICLKMVKSSFATSVTGIIN